MFAAWVREDDEVLALAPVVPYPSVRTTGPGAADAPPAFRPVSENQAPRCRRRFRLDGCPEWCLLTGCVCAVQEFGGCFPQASLALRVVGDRLHFGQLGLQHECTVAQVCPFVVKGHRGQQRP